MIIRLTLGIVLLASMYGCATTRQPTATGQVQIRMAQIENQLEDQSRMLSDLQETVDGLSLRSQQPRLEAKVDPLPPPVSVERAVAAPVKSSGDRGILRVPVTPQEVQIGLKNAGYYTGAIDGVLGSGSQKAIKEFQTDHDLVSDGIIGKKTWAQLKNYLD